MFRYSDDLPFLFGVYKDKKYAKIHNIAPRPWDLSLRRDQVALLRSDSPQEFQLRLKGRRKNFNHSSQHYPQSSIIYFVIYRYGISLEGFKNLQS